MPFHDLFIHLDRDNDGFVVRLDSDSHGRAFVEDSFDFDHRALPDRLRTIEKHLLSMFKGEEGGDWRKLVEGDLHGLGAELHHALTQGEVGRRLERVLGHLEDDLEATLRLRITTDPTDGQLHELAAAPWETLYDETQHEGYLGQRRRFPISRYFTGTTPVRSLRVDGPLKILLVPSLPEGPTPVAAATEMRTIREALKAVEGVEVHQGSAILDDLRDQVLDDSFHVVHFIGHGGFNDRVGEGWVTFEDEDMQPVRWPGDLLANWLRDLPTLRLVVLSNCYGATLPRQAEQNAFWTVAPPLMRANIPALVAMQFPISDQAAIAFSRRFYARLAQHDPIDVAVSEARMAICSLDQEPETRVQWPLPAVFMRVDDGRLTVPAESDDRTGGFRTETATPEAAAARKETLKIGIRSFAEGYGEGLEKRVDRFLGLDDLFAARGDGRSLRPPHQWNGELLHRLREFTSAFVTERRRLEIDFAAHSSIAFATGWLLEAKSGLDLTLVQRGHGNTRVYFKQDGSRPEGELWHFEERSIGRGTDLAVAVSVSRPVLDDVVEYLARDTSPAIGRVLHTIVPETGHSAIQGGLHALLLAQELDRVISRRTVPERRGTVHLLGSGPNAFLFFLGQLSRGWGDTQLYEYAFNQPKNFGEYSPSILLPPRS
ncbi:MAG: SAVED domain-containing protein [Acidobacteriota bacterium]